jgi:hypothetical protein
MVWLSVGWSCFVLGFLAGWCVRVSACRIATIPEPSSALLLGLSLAGSGNSRSCARSSPGPRRTFSTEARLLPVQAGFAVMRRRCPV